MPNAPPNVGPSVRVPLIFRAVAWTRVQAQNAFMATPVVRAIVE